MDDVEYIDPETIGGVNLFAYCNNNPVMNADPSGNFLISLSAIIVGAIIGSSVGLATTAYNDYKEDGILFNGNGMDYLFGGLMGAVTGAIGGVFANANFFTQLVVSSAVGSVSNIAEGFYGGTTKQFWSIDTLKLGVDGAIQSALSFFVSKGVNKMATKFKYKSIVGNNTSNHHINQALSKAGYGNLKIGKHGIKAIYKEMSKSTFSQGWEYFADSIFDFFVGVM